MDNPETLSQRTGALPQVGAATKIRPMSDPDRTKLTFSQAEGIDPLPQPVALGELSRQARVSLWDIIYGRLDEAAARRDWLHSEAYITEPWETILLHYHILHLHKPADEFSSAYEAHASEIKKLFLHGAFNQVFDFLQFVLRHPSTPHEFRDSVSSVLRYCMCAYTVIEDGTIVPISLPEQRKSIQDAFRVLKPGLFKGAQSHLRKSAECIKNGDLAGSVRESIHAVESVARRLNADAEKSLKPALDALSQKAPLHPAFKRGIENLYGYTSDEDGIRHALLGEQEKVDIDDAVFMFGACTLFTAYLVNKARTAGLLKQEDDD